MMIKKALLIHMTLLQLGVLLAASLSQDALGQTTAQAREQTQPSAPQPAGSKMMLLDIPDIAERVNDVVVNVRSNAGGG